MGLISTCWFFISFFIKPVFIASMPLLVYLQMAAWLEARPSILKGESEEKAPQATDTGPTSAFPAEPPQQPHQARIADHTSFFCEGSAPVNRRTANRRGPWPLSRTISSLERYVWLPSLTMALGCTVLAVHTGFSRSRNQTWIRFVWLPGLGNPRIPWS